MNKAMQLCDVAIKTITLIKFYENYMTKTGRLSWEAYKEKLEEVPTFHTPLWNYSSLLEELFHGANGIIHWHY